MGADLRDGIKGSYSLFTHKAHSLYGVKDRMGCMWKQLNLFYLFNCELISGAYPVVIAKWCCTAGACLLGQQWERRQQQGYQGPRSQDGSPQLSTRPASQGHPRPCSPHFAGMYTWNYAGRSVFSEETSPPVTTSEVQHQYICVSLVVTFCIVSKCVCVHISPGGVKLSKHPALDLDTVESLPKLGQ